MKILFIYPKFIKYIENHSNLLKKIIGEQPETLAEGKKFNATPALAIPILAAITPPSHTFKFINDNIEEIDYDTDADIVALSFFTPQATRAYEICEQFRERKKVVVVGGMHPSICPEEASRHADIVCIGEGENGWIEILQDVERGSYKPAYTARQEIDLNVIPIPNRSIYYDKKHLYSWKADVVQVVRGCNSNCQCVIPHVFGKKLRFKDIIEVGKDILSTRFNIVYLADDQIFKQDETIEKYAFQLFHHIKELGVKKQFFINTFPTLNHNPELLKLMGEAGVTSYYSTIGFDPLTQNALLKGRKNLRQMLIDQVKMVQDAGMIFFGSFPLGLDEHDLRIKQVILDFCLEANIRFAEFFIPAPLPGMPFWNQLKKENRILSYRWEEYNGGNVTFRPKHMSPEQLMEIYFELCEKFYRVGALNTFSLVGEGSAPPIPS